MAGSNIRGRNRSALPAKAGLLAGLLLAACSTGRQSAPVAVTPVAPVTPPEMVGAPPPAPAEFSSAATLWALRGGLNVAALLCNDRSLSSTYNAILKTHRKLLNEAYATEQARFRQLHGSAWQARHDAAMTRLYNGFASVPDRGRFCTMASRVAAELAGTASDAVPRMAARALTTLEPGAMRLVNSAN